LLKCKRHSSEEGLFGVCLLGQGLPARNNPNAAKTIIEQQGRKHFAPTNNKLNKTIMKKNLSTILRSYALLPIWGLGGLFFIGCATTNQSNAVKQTASTNADTPPVYYTGNDEPAGSGVFIYTATTNNLNQQ
jgi:hypothetical protein